MKDSVFWKEIQKEDGRNVKMPFKVCERCEKEFSSGNTFASIYCPDCSAETKKEKTRERVRKHRERLKNG